MQVFEDRLGQLALLWRGQNTIATLAALALAWHARTPGGQLSSRGLTTTFTVTVALLGQASMAMHATNSAAGGILDVLSMHLIAAFAAISALSRLAHLGTMRTILFFALTVGVATRATHRGGRIEFLHHTGNLLFALMLLAAIVMEVILCRRSRPRAFPRWGAAALATMLLAFGVWLISQTGGPWCLPDSWLQGHALWHILCALAVYCFGRHYTATRTR